jgi:hypothetical protein
MRRILVRGSYVHDIIDDLKPGDGVPVLDKSGKGSCDATLQMLKRGAGFSAGVTVSDEFLSAIDSRP